MAGSAAKRTEGRGGRAALAGTAEGATVERTQRARGKSKWTVFEVLDRVEVYEAGSMESALGAAYSNGRGDASDEKAGVSGDSAMPAPTVRGDGRVLVQLQVDVEARTGQDACWMLAEGPLRDRAESETPPVLQAINQRGDGYTEARPYGLEKVVQRRSS
jgi:hypothetical protein